MSAAATASLLTLLETTRGVDGRGIEISQKGVNECVARGLSVIQGDADTDLVDYPDDAFDFVILSADAAGDPPPAPRRSSRCCASGRRRSSRFPNFGHWRIRGLISLHRAHAGDTATCPIPGTTRPTSTSAPSATSSRSATRCTPTSRRAIALNVRGERIGLNAPWWFWNLFGQQAVFLLSRQARTAIC